MCSARARVVPILAPVSKCVSQYEVDMIKNHRQLQGRDLEKSLVFLFKLKFFFSFFSFSFFSFHQIAFLLGIMKAGQQPALVLVDFK